MSFLGLPIYGSQNHLLGAEDFWQDRIMVYDESGTNRQLPSQYDESFVTLEPKSGATFEALLYLQSSIYLQPDLLFPVERVMLPAFTVYRSANLTE